MLTFRIMAIVLAMLSFSSTTFATGTAYIKDDPTSGTNGGGCTSGGWVTRNLLTREGDTGIVSLSNHEFTLTAGDYEISWSTPGYKVDTFKSRLYNVTASAEWGQGSSETAAASDDPQARSFGGTKITLAGTTTFRLEFQCQTTKATNGRGVAVSFGTEIYSIVRIQQL